MVKVTKWDTPIATAKKADVGDLIEYYGDRFQVET